MGSFFFGGLLLLLSGHGEGCVYLWFLWMIIDRLDAILRKLSEAA